MDWRSVMSKDKSFKEYHEKPKKYRPDGTVEAGKGKRRPHHKDAQKGVQLTGDENTDKHRRKVADMNYIPRTANKFQTVPNKVDEDAGSYTYEWIEDNGHKDHCQLKRKQVAKEEERLPLTLHSPTTKEYKDNYEDIFGKRKMGSQTGKVKKTKKVYK